MSTRQWKPVPELAQYEVSDDGLVRRVRSTRGGRVRVLDATVTARGYYRVELWNDGRRRAKYVQELVLESFGKPRPAGLQARHLDGDPRNNTLGNLAWGTCAENHLDRIRHGRAAKKLTPSDVLRIRASSRTAQLAEELGVARSTIKSIRGMRTWKHV